MAKKETVEYEASVGKYVGKYGDRTYTNFRVAIPKDIGERLDLVKGDMVHITMTPTGQKKIDMVGEVTVAKIEKEREKLKKMEDRLKDIQKQKKQ